MQALVTAIDYHLPEAEVTSRQLAESYANWTEDKIVAKTGIACRHIAAAGECASDLAVAAAQKLFAAGAARADEIDYLLLCTQSPDYFLPTTACLVQHRLGLRTSIGALDFNLGCSGFVYGLGLARGLIATEQARRVLLITAETYSKFLRAEDVSTRTLFGDAAAAILIEAGNSVAGKPGGAIGPMVYGTDGAGARNLIVERGGFRSLEAARTGGEAATAEPPQLSMNGPEIFSFTLRAVPPAVAALLDRAGLTLDEIDLFVFHQANQFMLEHLRDKLEIPPDKFFLAMRHCGNTVSSTIPIALRHALLEGQIRPGSKVMLVGFGVGYSWGATLLTW